MRVKVKLLGWMRQFLADHIEHFDERDFDLPEDATAADLVAALGFGDTSFMLMRNGDKLPDELFATTTLHAGDSLVFVPPLKGG
ncbi:MAG: MoaD/ThiS family protein [Gammaproteobacteria bacterium]|nr:MoaD/ThiS family protein [Gammaproteobacteria bacterium]